MDSINRLKRYFKNKLKIDTTQTIILGFALLIIIGSLILNLPIASKDHQSIGYINALFTATSAVCVTGLVIADTYSQWSLLGQITILILIQIGGLGFMTVATLFSFALRRKIGLKERLLIVESLNYSTLQGVVGLTKKVLIGTLIFESIGAIILSIKFIPNFGLLGGIFKGIFHAVSAFCNAGFDLMGEYESYSSLMRYDEDPVVSIVVIGLIIVGGLGYSVWNDVFSRKKARNYSLHTKMVLSITGFLIVFGFIFFFLVEYNNLNTLGPLSIQGKVISSLFQAVTPRTAGFNTISQVDMTQAAILVTMILMFIGGSPGSTAGGIKTTTFGVLVISVISVIKKKENINLFERRLCKDIVMRSLAIAFIGFIMISTATIVLSFFENAHLIDILFETISAFGTVGLSLGLTTQLSDISKLVIIVLMFLGRVGVLTFVIGLSLRSNDYITKYSYPKEKIMIG